MNRRALEIIQDKVSPEGFNVPQELLATLAVERVLHGDDKVFRYGRVVLTVSRDPEKPSVHLYAKDSGTELLSALARFHEEVWNRVRHQFLIAPIQNDRIAQIALRFGWKHVGWTPSGIRLFRIERSQQ